MNKQLYLAILIVFLFGSVKAQEQATPSPSPMPTVETTPTPENPLPKIDDEQKVQPENLRGVPAIAPDFKSNDTSLPELGRVGVDMMRQRPLSLNEAIAFALENNKDIEVSRQNVRLAEFDLQSANGFYDSRFTGQTFYERATVPNVSIFSTNRTTTANSFAGNVGFQDYIKKYGTVFNVTGNNSRLGSDNPISILSPQYNTSLTFSITQPLFRGRSFDQPRRTIEIAKRNLSLTDTQFRQRSIDIITNVQRAYWDLTFNLRNLQVQRDSVRDAKEQMAHNRRLVAEGQLAPSDIIASETQVANFEQNVYTALEDVNRSENTLKNLIAENRNDLIWNASIVPTESIDLNAPATTLPEALSLALQNRPEIEIANVQRDINEIDQRFLRDQAKPQIDLIASYTTAGIGGSQNPNFRSPFSQVSPCLVVETPEQCAARQLQQQTAQQQQQQTFLQEIGGAGSTFTDILSNRYPTFRAGIQFNLPLKNTTAKAQLGRSLVQSEQIRTRREQVEQNIQVDVRNALQSVRSSEARLRTAAIARQNSEKQYASEQRKLDAGQSNVYQVLERQTALITARSAELRSQTELNKSIADLQRATGNSLKANNVEARLRK
ncbi:MAG TPA: TolC family protein [Pyrinomonadaceae bacterium]|nr:TolC family protein [Pyrinomonadaceae bacterium]